MIALPFELVPSDAPLSLLEVKALGKPIITTNLACIPELVANARSYLAFPSNPISLAAAIKSAAEYITSLEKADKSKIIEELKVSLRSWHQMGIEWSNLIDSQ
jgi:glycosyltransferase involved in cell wall biosynthesis